MFCHQCGAQIAEGAAFCHKCGAKVGVDVSDVPAESKVTDLKANIDIVITFNVRGGLNKLMFKGVKMNVLIDNLQIGALSYGETVTDKIAPGQHCIIMGAMWIWIDVPEGCTPIQLATQMITQEDGTSKYQLVCEPSHLVIPPPSGSLPELGGLPYCPSCGSQDLSPISESEVTVSGGGYGFGSGCCGWILLGPIGLLCGFCGRGVKSKSTTRKYWFCKSCGHKFRDIEDEYEEKQQVLAVMGFVSFIIAFIVPAVFEYFDINFLWLPPRAYQIIGILSLAGFLAGKFYLFYNKIKK